MPQTETPQFAALAPAYEMWLAARLQEGSSYDEIVEADYRAFLRVVGETLRLSPMRICGYGVNPNHAITGTFCFGPRGTTTSARSCSG